uniref:B30.2/SPRY domain-containing protein n=1 Tax=Globodera pallida TaxID=36090 RepID=A0A183BIG0_GLOPA
MFRYNEANEKAAAAAAGTGSSKKIKLVKVPEVKVPEVKVPEVKVPEVKVPEVEVPDVEVSAFKVMLSFIYATDLSGLNGDNAMSVLYAANIFHLPKLVDSCLNFPIPELNSVFFALDQARFLGEEALRWADEKCRQNGIECSAKNRRAMLGTALYKIRFPLIPQKDFTENIVPSGVLEKDEQAGVYQYYSHPDAGLPELDQLKFPTNRRADAGLTLQNRWDSAASHEKLALSEPAGLTVQHNGKRGEWHSVFAERPIPKGKSGTFYYEVTISGKRMSAFTIGLATKQMPLDNRVGENKGTYAYASWGIVLVEGANAPTYETDEEIEAFGDGDVIGCGVNLANRQIFFTKNGHRLAFLQIDQESLCEILDRDELMINEEIAIWNAALRWADEKCRQNGSECSAENRRAMLGPALYKIRFPLIPQKDFTENIVPSGVLEKDEQAGVYQYYSHPDAGLPELDQLKFPTNRRADAGLTLQNRWDSASAACHKKLALSGPARLIVQFIGKKEEWRSVFAERPIPKGKSGTFYYEVTITGQRIPIFLWSVLTIGLATKQMPLDNRVGENKGTYAYASWGIVLVEGANAPTYETDEEIEAFGDGDVIGCGVNLANRQIFYTKNGHRLGENETHFFLEPADLLVDFGAVLFPCISLHTPGTKIEANFGPEFKYNIPAEGI